MTNQEVIKILNSIKIKPMDLEEFVTGSDNHSGWWGCTEKQQEEYNAYNKLCLEQNYKIDKIIEEL